jgi:hypothetical protein
MEKPSPAPISNSNSDMTAAASAPAMIGAQLTADDEASTGASTRGGVDEVSMVMVTS